MFEFLVESGNQNKKIFALSHKMAAVDFVKKNKQIGSIVSVQREDETEATYFSTEALLTSKIKVI